MKCSIQRGEAELNGTFHLSPNENICSIARMRKHSLFVLYNLYKEYYADACVTLNARTAPVAFAQLEYRT